MGNRTNRFAGRIWRWLIAPIRILAELEARRALAKGLDVAAVTEPPLQITTDRYLEDRATRFDAIVGTYPEMTDAIYVDPAGTAHVYESGIATDGTAASYGPDDLMPSVIVDRSAPADRIELFSLKSRDSRPGAPVIRYGFDGLNLTRGLSTAELAEQQGLNPLIGSTELDKVRAGVGYDAKRPSVTGLAHPSGELMPLANSYTLGRKPVRACAEPKIDGIPLICVDGSHFTREAGPFGATAWLADQLQTLDAAFGDQAMVILGEYTEGTFEDTLSSFRSGAGNRGMGKLYVFDALPLSAWQGRTPSAPLRERKRQLYDAFTASPGLTSLVLMPSFPVASHDDVMARAEGVWKGGGEGLVVKDLDAPFVRGRTDAWLKLKREETVDVPIVAYGWHPRPEGGHRYRLSVDYNGKAVGLVGELPRDVVAELDRRRCANPTGALIGDIVEVKHNGVTAKGSLRSARLVRIRDDKVRSIAHG